MTIDALAAALPQQLGWPAKTPDQQATPAQTSAPVPAPVPVAVQQQTRKPEPSPTADALQAAVKQIDSYLKGSQRTLQFSVDDATGVTVVSVKDSNGDVIRQIPNEDVLRLARSLGEGGSKSLLEIAV